MSPTNSRLACTLGKPEIKTTDIAISALEHDAPKHVVKFNAPEHDTLVYCAYERETFVNMVNDMKATANVGTFDFGALGHNTVNFGGLYNSVLVNDTQANGGHIMPRLQEPSNKKMGTAGLAWMMTLGTTIQKLVDLQ